MIPNSLAEGKKKRKHSKERLVAVTVRQTGRQLKHLEIVLGTKVVWRIPSLVLNAFLT